MCGIVGILHYGGILDSPMRVEKMSAAIIHRGPDGKGFWHDKDIALGFRRLSILDHMGGSQPMTNEDGQVWVIFNGEIYNHLELRSLLTKNGHRFRSDHSDTEILVHGWEEWREELPNYLNGMFAFAVWDKKHRTLFLARDRYGIKPLYFSYLPEKNFVFSSEIRPIHDSGLVDPKPNRNGVLEYFSQQNLCQSQTMFEDIEQFPTASWMKLERGKLTTHRYWDYSFKRNTKLSLKEAAEQHRSILKNAIQRQMMADVPITCYLSGGIDSSSLAAGLRQLEPNSAIKTYSCLFNLNSVGDDKVVDERDYSRKMATFLNSDHTELELPQDALVRSLEPTIRSLEDIRMGMAYVNYLIAERVAKDSKVVLSGTGGDELHGGYLYRYQAVKPTIIQSGSILQKLLSIFRNGATAVTEKQLNIYYSMLNFPISENLQKSAFTTDFLHNTDEYLVKQNLGEFFADCPSEDIWDKVMYVDARTYLHGLLLIEDRLSMAHSLETRVPLLDNELVDFLLTLPWSYLNDTVTGKIIFRESVKSWVPSEIYHKPKMGFGPPDASWYRGLLRPFIEQTLHPKRITKRGILRPSFVKNVLNEHFSGQRNHVAMIWSLLSFETWCSVFNMYGGELNVTI